MRESKTGDMMLTKIKVRFPDGRGVEIGPNETLTLIFGDFQLKMQMDNYVLLIGELEYKPN